MMLFLRVDSASNTFLQSVNRRVNVAGVDLNMLESNDFRNGKNQSDLLALHYHLLSSSSNYNPFLDLDEDFDVEDCYLDNFSTGSDDLGLKKNILVEEEDPLLDDSLSLKKFGISDVCLATLHLNTGEDLRCINLNFTPVWRVWNRSKVKQQTI